MSVNARARIERPNSKERLMLPIICYEDLKSSSLGFTEDLGSKSSGGTHDE